LGCFCFAEKKKNKDPKLLKLLEDKACCECQKLAEKLREVTDEKTKEEAKELYLKAETFYYRTEASLTDSPKAKAAWEKLKKKYGEAEAEAMANEWENEHNVSRYDAFIFDHAGNIKHGRRRLQERGDTKEEQWTCNCG
jgi:hypothetical protein